MDFEFIVENYSNERKKEGDMDDDGFFWVVFFSLLLLMMSGIQEESSQPKVSAEKKVAMVEQRVEGKRVMTDEVSLDGRSRIIREDDIHTANFQIDLVHGGYVGTGPATETIMLKETWYPNKYQAGANGLIINAGLHEHHISFRSVFGGRYDCYVFTRHLTDLAIVRDEKGEGRPYLAEVKSLDDKTLSVVLKPTTEYVLKELDNARAAKAM